MTLVVARLEGDSAHIFSDSKLTYRTGDSVPYLDGMLKTVIVKLEVCISFAGDVGYAKKAIAHLIKEKFESVIGILNYLIEVHRESNLQTEFGIVSNISKEPALFCIKDGKFGRNLTHFWLGDAFSQYQKHYLQCDEDIEVKHKMRQAMENVIHDGNVGSVGGFLVSVSTDHDNYSFTENSTGNTRPISGFSYEAYYSATISDVETIPNMEQGKWYDIKRASKGYAVSDSVSTFKSISPCHPGIAFYYRQANAGFLFCPNLQIELDNHDKFLNLIKFDEIDVNAFCTRVKETHNIRLSGVVDNGDGSATFVQT